jgi:phage tail-like protein
MDVNQSRFVLLQSREDFLSGQTTYTRDLAFCAKRQAAVVMQQQDVRLPARDPAKARAMLASTAPEILDRFGQHGVLSKDRKTLLVSIAGRKPTPVLADVEPITGSLRKVSAPSGQLTDIAIGGELLAMLFAGGGGQGLLVLNLRRRWLARLDLAEAGRRILVDPMGRLLVASDSGLQVFRLGETFRVDEAPAIELLSTTPWPNPAQPLAMAADEKAQFVLAAEAGDGQAVFVRPSGISGDFIRRELPASFPFATDMALVPVPSRDEACLALLCWTVSDQRHRAHCDCPVVSTAGDGPLALVRQRFPLLDLSAPRFVGSADGVARYVTAAGPRELVPLFHPRYARRALLSTRLDSGAIGCVWHRLYLDAEIPQGTRVRAFAQAYDEIPQAEQAGDGTDPGQQVVSALQAAASGQASGGNPGDNPQCQPDLVWVPMASELPFAGGAAKSIPGQSGLFEVLLQAGGGNVRRIAGRYLRLGLVLESDGRHTPAIHAARVYYPRFSYQEQYLPGHFRQQDDRDESKPLAPANGADFRERFFALAEAMLTPIEGQVASVETLLDPRTTPTAFLPWLASFVGVSLDCDWPEARRRRLLREFGRLARLRGTLAGTQLWLDIISDGGVGRGEVVLVENFRLRRTMATLLGVKMDDKENPLTLGFMESGNSIIGDTLVLSDASAREFLALLDPSLADKSEQEQVEAFFDKYAHKLTVLLHGPARQDKASIERLLGRVLPAHLQTTILVTDHPFILGLSPLLAIDTYVEKMPAPRPVVLGDTQLSTEGLLQNPAALSPADVSPGNA